MASKRKVLPYHALQAVEDAQASIFRAQQLVRDMLACAHSQTEQAQLALMGWELEKALRRLGDIRRDDNE